LRGSKQILTGLQLSLLHRPEECAILQQPSGVESFKGRTAIFYNRILIYRVLSLPLTIAGEGAAVHESCIETAVAALCRLGLDRVWDWVALGWPKRGPRATQAWRKGHPWVKLSKRFVCNKSWKRPGGGGRIAGIAQNPKPHR